MLGYFQAFFHLRMFLIFLLKLSFKNIIRVLKRLDPDQLNNVCCLIWVQTLSLGHQLTIKDVTSIERV